MPFEIRKNKDPGDFAPGSVSFSVRLLLPPVFSRIILRLN
jgi:hypothetical protein